MFQKKSLRRRSPPLNAPRREPIIGHLTEGTRPLTPAMPQPISTAPSSLREHRSSIRACVIQVCSCRRPNAPAGSAVPITGHVTAMAFDEFARAVTPHGQT
jgi:hypothetical protein